MELPREIEWDDAIKKRIKDAILTEIGRVRICQKVFPTRIMSNNPTEVPFDALEFDPAGNEIRIPEGVNKPFVELSQEFPLTGSQVHAEKDRRYCETIARMVAKGIALAEDMIFFQGDDRPGANPLPGNVNAARRRSADRGLIGVASPIDPNDADDANPNKVSQPIDVPLAPAVPNRPDLLWGANTFSAVARGVAKLVSKAQAPDYALFLPTRVFADAHNPPGDQSLVIPADRIKPLVAGGFHGTGMLPPDKGLLVALGGEPTVLYVGREAELEYVRKEGDNYRFRVTERIQFVPRDPRAIVLLNFEQPP